MARTRNSDPGRVSALHYATTPRQRHAKPLVYAYLLLPWLGAWCGGGGLGTLYAQEQVPCVACQVLSILPQQADLVPETRISRRSSSNARSRSCAAGSRRRRF